MKKVFFIVFVVCFSVYSCKNENEKIITKKEVKLISQNDIDRIEPPNWWANFKSDNLQLLVHHNNIADFTPEIHQPEIKITKISKGNNSNNYLFIDLNITEAKAGKFNIFFKNNQEELIATYELKKRQRLAEDYIGFNSSDAIYLITPDRFSNGNPQNDTFQDLQEKTINRNDSYARHGGDISGITNHINYIKNLGFTAIWPQPMLTNDMEHGSYHGYAITDLYKVDPRFGTLEEYKGLSKKLRDNGMKLIMDQVANHCGLYHWWMEDLPFTDWVNLQKNYEDNIKNWDNSKTINSNHRRTTNQDNYASEIDKKGNYEGWFVSTMPDLNQRNPFMANYIIQNSIWWIETAQLSGIRQDTYPYPDKQFMSDWAGAIMSEYPNFSIVGEEWSYNPLLIGYWQKGANNKDGYKSNLKSTMDFAMQQNVVDAIKENESWDTGLTKIYEGLANDFHYASPKDIMVFPDNHDMSRIFTQLDGDVTNTKMALATYATMPRIFQMYYGTEILMNDFKKPGDHGLIRTDFPGGWQDDKISVFSGKGLTEAQKNMQEFVTKLLNFRKKSNAIHTGKTIHFAPKNGVYLLARSSGDETVILILNKNEKPITLNTERFEELQLNGKILKNIFDGKAIKFQDTINLNTKGVLVLTTRNN